VNGLRTAGDNPDQQRYPRLQGRLQDQLAFVNNLLITLAVAVLAFATSAATDTAELQHLGWRRWLLGSALVLLALSLVTGVALAVNRLQSFRITAQIARIADLRDQVTPPGAGGPNAGRTSRDRLRRRSEALAVWSRFGLPADQQQPRSLPAVPARARLNPPFAAIRQWTLDRLLLVARRTDRSPAEKAALAVAAALAEPDTQSRSNAGTESPLTAAEVPADAAQPPDPVADAIHDLLETLRHWTAGADRLTWRLLWWQTAVFLAAAIVLLLVPLTLYF
jgi:hypothetical protein